MQYVTFLLCVLKLLLVNLTTTTSATTIDTRAAADNSWSVRTGNDYITLNNAFTANITGSTSDGQFSIRVSRSRGIVTQGNRATTIIVNAAIPRTSDYAVYNFIGSDSNGLLTGRAYCNSFGALTAMWIEDSTSSSGLRKTSATGTCDIGKASATDLYQVSDGVLNIDEPAGLPSIQGSQINLQPNEVGSIVLNKNYTLLPYNVIDCKDCGDTPSDGWVEIHSILNYQPTKSDICMGILYLYVQQGPIALSWLNCFQPQQPNGTFAAVYDIGSVNTNTSGMVAFSAVASAIATSTATSIATATPSPAPTSGNDLSSGTKIGIGVAVPVIVLGVLALAALVWFRRRQKKGGDGRLYGRRFGRSNMEKPPRAELDQSDGSSGHTPGEQIHRAEVPAPQRKLELDGGHDGRAFELPTREVGTRGAS